MEILVGVPITELDYFDHMHKFPRVLIGLEN